MTNSHHALLSPLENSDEFNNICDLLQNRDPRTAWVNGIVDAQKWHFAAGLLKSRNAPALIIAPSELKAKAIYEDMYYFFRESCHIYPSRDLLFYAADVKSPDITRQRLRVLDKLKNAEAPPVIIISAEALLDRMTPPETFHRYRMSISVGDVVEPQEIMRKLVQMGYDRSSLAEGPGQFALRGGILDIYPAVGSYYPVAQGATPQRSEEAEEGFIPTGAAGV